MGVPPYTRIDVINEGLSQAARVDLTSNARKWLNLFLQKVYMNWDWPWLLKSSGTSPYLTTSQGMNLPSDYRAMKNCTLYNVYNGIYVPQRELVPAGNDEWMALLRMGSVAQSQPRRLWIDVMNQQLQFWPPPDQGYPFLFYYFYMPTLPTDADSSGDSAVPLWPNLPQDVLIRAIQFKAKFFNDDEAYQAEEDALLKELQLAKFNSYDVRAGSNKIKLGKSFRRRY